MIVAVLAPTTTSGSVPESSTVYGAVRSTGSPASEFETMKTSL